MLISSATPDNILEFQDSLRDALQQCDSLARAGQTITSTFWETFTESVVLVRFFATLPATQLPAHEQEFARRLLSTSGVREQLGPDTLVLSLLGTRGTEIDWNYRERSRGHLAIPLASPDFIGSIPMVSRLLRELQVHPVCLAPQADALENPQVEVRLSAGQVGVFYVQNAREAVDERNRAIISAQDFVADYGVKTVFGLGGIYPDGTVPVLLVFTRELLTPEQVHRFTHLIVLIKAATTDLLRRERIITPAG